MWFKVFRLDNKWKWELNFWKLWLCIMLFWLEQKLLKTLWTFRVKNHLQFVTQTKQHVSMSDYNRGITIPSHFIWSPCLKENSLKMKTTSSIRLLKLHHKHTQTDIQAGQLIETGAEVSPGSWAQLVAYGWAPLCVDKNVCSLPALFPKQDSPELCKKLWFLNWF